MNRLVLDYKKINYETVWINFPDIEPTAKALGVAPTKLKADGTPAYTVPFITVISQDKTILTIADSLKITEYLEKTYPNPDHRLLPAETRVFQSIFTKYLSDVLQPAMGKLMLMPIVRALPAESQEWYLETRDTFYGKGVRESLPKDEASFFEAWKAFEKAFDDLAVQLDAAGEGNFRVTGDVSFSEFELVVLLYLTKRLLYEDGWKGRLESRNGGRWAKLLNLPVYKELLPIT